MDYHLENRYESLVKEVETKLGRNLTEEEKSFIMWITNNEHKYSD